MRLNTIAPAMPSQHHHTQGTPLQKKIKTIADITLIIIVYSPSSYSSSYSSSTSQAIIIQGWYITSSLIFSSCNFLDHLESLTKIPYLYKDLRSDCSFDFISLDIQPISSCTRVTSAKSFRVACANKMANNDKGFWN